MYFIVALTKYEFLMPFQRMYLVVGNKQMFSGFLKSMFSRNVKELCLWKGFGTKRLVYVMNAFHSYQGQCGDHEIALRGLKHSHHGRRKLCNEISHNGKLPPAFPQKMAQLLLY